MPVSDFNWLEADGDYTRLLKASLSSLSKKEISELEQKPDPRQFKRIHRSTIINLHGVKEVFREPSGPQVVLLYNQVVLLYNKVTKVSRSYTDVLKKWIF